MTISFTEPKLCKTPSEWYVYFEVTIGETKYERKLREGINRIKDPKQRETEGNALADARHVWFKAGWNPVTDPKFKARNVVIVCPLCNSVQLPRK